MILKRLNFAAIILILSAVTLQGASLSVSKNEKNLVIFFSQGDSLGAKAVLKGIVVGMGAREISTAKEKELGQNIQDRTKASVRLIPNEDVIPGSVLYIVDDRNLVVAKFTALTVFKSVSFEKMCVGYGNFRGVNRDFRLVQKVLDSKASEAYLYIARGNYYRDTNDISAAMENYEKAVRYDKENPEAHSALGYIYLEQKLIPYAIREFNSAYTSKGRVYDKEDRYMLLRGCAESRYMAVFQSDLPKGFPQRDRYENEGIKFCKEAIHVYPDSIDVHYFLGMFYYGRSTEALTKIETENDEKAVAEMKKVIELKDDHFEAHMVIARIYKKHGNKEKALLYASKACQIDPSNKDSRDFEKAVRNMK